MKGESETTVAAEAKTEAAKEKRKDVEVQLEYLDGRFFKKRNVDLYNVHVYRQYKSWARSRCTTA